jgi:hypothetical protein
MIRTIASKLIVASGVFQLWSEVRLNALRFANYDHNNTGALDGIVCANKRIHSRRYLELVYFLVRATSDLFSVMRRCRDALSPDSCNGGLHIYQYMETTPRRPR